MLARMASEKLFHWQIYVLRREAQRLGVVEAPDSDSAIKAAIEKLKLTERDWRKLFALRVD